MKKLRNRLYVALLPLQVLLAGLAVWTFFLLANLGALVNDAKSTHEEFAHVLDDALLSLREFGLLVEMTEEVDGRNLREEIRESFDRYDALIVGIQDNAHAQKSDQLPALGDVHEQLEPSLAKLLNDINDPLVSARRNQLLRLVNEAETLLEGLSVKAIDELLNLQEAFRDRIGTSFAVLAGGILLGVLGTLLISRQIGRMVLTPLERLENKLGEISRGNLDVEADLNRRDEIGQLARSFNVMVVRLREYRNSTDQKLLATTRTFRNVLQRTPHPILFLTGDMQVFYANPQAGSLLEAPEFHKKLPKKLIKFATGAIESGDIVMQDHLQDALRLNVGRQPKYFFVTAFPVDLVGTDDNDHTGLSAEGVALLMQDVTQMKLADNLKSNLVATVSHELKTPLTSARMSLYLLSEQSIGPLNEDQQELVDTAKEDLERQLSTIQNLLDLSRFEQSNKRLQREPSRANEIIQRSILAHRDLAESCEVEITADLAEEDPYIMADSKRIEIVLNNFLANALRHAPANSEVIVQDYVKGDEVHFNVCDQGPGVPDDYRDIIFERYAQGADSRSHGSAGLGLHISKEIIEDHGGRIGCDSVLGDGSTFYFVLQSIPNPDSTQSNEQPTETNHANE